MSFKQEVVLNLLQKVSTLPSLVAEGRVKILMQLFQCCYVLHVGYAIKGSCDFMGESLSK